MEGQQTYHHAGSLVRYDARQRRVWIVGRRLHHGLAGAFLATAGFLLMVHDWRDRASWFRFGA
jgi:hypothetical protein